MSAVRPGIAFPHRHPHELAHLAPLISRLGDVTVHPPEHASVRVMSSSEAPHHGSWNVQVFHGMGDKGYTLNPLLLQQGHWPRLRTALNIPLARLGLPAPFMRPPPSPPRRRGRYQQVNAYGPRWGDLLEDMLRTTVVSRFGHPALNDLGTFTSDPEGPILWLPTWDNRHYLGGVNQSSLSTMGGAVASLASAATPFLVKVHPLTVRHRQEAGLRRRLAETRHVTMAPASTSPYELLQGCRGVLTDTSSIGFEAYCMGLPVAIVQNPGVGFTGLHAELAERTHVMDPDAAELSRWSDAPESPSDMAWARDMLFAPSPQRNDLFAAQLRGHLTESPL